MSICPSCNAVNPVDYQFCQFCGSKIATEVVNHTKENLVVNASLNLEDDTNPQSDLTQPLNLDNNFSSIDPSNNLEISSKELENGSENNAIAITIPIYIPEIQKVEIADKSSNESTDLDTLFDVDPHPSLTSKSDLIISSYKQLQNVAYAGKTDVGRQRDLNEDDFVTIFQTRSIHGKSQIRDRSQRGLFVLCDGMGGHEGGSEASKTAVNSITDQFLPFWIDTLPGQKKLNEIITNANQEIFLKNENENRQALGRMGTTLVMLTIHDLKVAIAHVGDSRIYQVTNTLVPDDRLNNLEEGIESASLNCKYPKLEQLTRDHEVFNQLIDLGIDRESALARPDAHQLTQALGPNPNSLLEPAIQFLTLTESTLFLLCSDGLSDNDAIEQNWQTHLLPILNKEVDLETGLEKLIELGNKINGYDNITAILVLCDVI